MTKHDFKPGQVVTYKRLISRDYVGTVISDAEADCTECEAFIRTKGPRGIHHVDPNDVRRVDGVSVDV